MGAHREGKGGGMALAFTTVLVRYLRRTTPTSPLRISNQILRSDLQYPLLLFLFSTTNTLLIIFGQWILDLRLRNDYLNIL